MEIEIEIKIKIKIKFAMKIHFNDFSESGFQRSCILS